MRKLAALSALALALFAFSATASVADSCACGGSDYIYWGPYWHQDSPYVPGHYDCIWYRQATGSYEYVHGC